YTANPRVDPTARRIDEVSEITGEIEAMAGDVGSAGAKGGMKTKVMAAQIAVQAGVAMAITLGDRHRPLAALAEGAACTWFLPAADPGRARKRWIAAMKPLGRLSIDAGAAAALRRGKSLLPAGLTGVSGSFGRGDPVTIAGPDGAAVGAALAGYSAAEAARLIGVRSDRIAGVLGYPGRAALAHADDMVVWGTRGALAPAAGPGEDT
ncbi:MAG: PUA domain-containing protein, partial [Pseudomonadota bacterium]